MRSAPPWLVVSLGLTLPTLALAEDHVAAARSDVEFSDYVEGASRLEGRIRAPCCWNQTLDIHSSEISTQMRREIRARLRAGEAPELIEADFVARYGERVLAAPPASPIRGLGVLLSLGVVLGGLGAGIVVKRWHDKARTKPPPSAVSESAPDALDERLDRELEQL